MTLPSEGAADAGGGTVAIVIQTRVRPEAARAFADWQAKTSAIVATFPGFIEQTVMPPSPPQQVDWVILQRFAREADAVGWLNSQQRQRRIAGVAGMLFGNDDVHILKEGHARVLPAPIAIVISTRIRPGCEPQYRQWEQRIAAAQTRAKGFLGYRFEPPIPGIQPDYLSILRFDTEENLQAWMDAPERQRLLEEAGDFTQEFHARTVRTGFDQWFANDPAAPGPAAWKANMVVLLLLYPVVFLFGAFVMSPYLLGWAGLPFAVALFLANVVSILLLNACVPWTSDRLAWWLRPATRALPTDIAGAALLCCLYAVMIALFVKMS
jgi:antibiotic biosynthesis monooxygenase (ABM) superfamily enzyme